MKSKTQTSATPVFRRAFTLVELLIVVVIIIVLVSIGFPMVKSMKANAARTECMNRLRSWSVAFGGYAADHDGKINWEHWPSIGTNPLEYSPYVSYWTGDSTDTSGFEAHMTQRNCPAIPWKRVPGGPNSPVNYATIQPVGVSGVGISGRAEKGLSSDYSLSKIRNPGRFMLMIDATGAKYTVSTVAEFNTKVKPLTVAGTGLRHNYSVNALFADYSVKQMSWKEIEKGLSYWSTF